MDSMFTSPCLSQFSPPNFRTRYLIRTHKFIKKPTKTLSVKHNFKAFAFQGRPKSSKPVKDQNLVVPRRGDLEKEVKASSGFSSFQCLVKSLAFTLLCFAIGLSNFSPNGELKCVAMAAVVEKLGVRGKKEEKKEGAFRKNEHEFSDYTRRLLEVVSGLLRRVEEVRNGNGDVKDVGEVLKAVKVKKEQLQGEIMTELYRELRELRREKVELEKRAEKIVDKVVKVESEKEKGKGKGKGKGGRGGKGKGKGTNTVEKLEEGLDKMEEEYSGIWERIGEIEDEILRRETTALSIGVRELCFIERECEELVQRFNNQMRKKELLQR